MGFVDLVEFFGVVMDKTQSAFFIHFEKQENGKLLKIVPRRDSCIEKNVA